MTSAIDVIMGPAPGEAAPSGPFGTGAKVYASLDYTGIVPVRTTGAKAKTIAKKGVSGRKGAQTLPKHYTGPKALPRYKDHNIGWRLPYGVIGIDVDQYDDKHGADDLKALVAEMGPLPDTWSTTARGEGPSRIYYYRVPEDCGELAGSLSESIEIIQHHHRYAMVWPSVHEKTGNTYAWYNGHRSDTPPTIDQFAELPAAWLERLSKPQRDHRDGMGLGVEDFRSRYTEESDTDLSGRIRDRFDSTPSCRHDSMVIALGWACRSATYGLVNAGEIFDSLAADWDEATAGEGRDDEFDAMVRDVVASTPEPDDGVKDDEYEPEAEDHKDTEGIDFGGVSKEIRIEALRILRHQEAMDLVRAHKARQRVGEAITVSDALDEILNGEDDADAPSVGKIENHENGWGLFYPSHINGIYGDGAIGKSVIISEVQARVLRDGGTVVHWEFDNNPLKAIIRRLVNANAPVDAIRHRFHVLFTPGDRDALPDSVKRSAALVTLDALNPAVTFFEMDPYHPTGIDTALQECLRPFTLSGACGLFVDHVGHENKERQAGSIRKAQAVQGALYEAAMIAELKPGTTGRTRLVLRKDNRGFLGSTGRSIAVAVMTSGSTDSPGRVVTVFDEPDPFNISEDRPDTPMTDAQNVDRIVREMDRAGLPTDLSQRAARDWLKDHEIEIKSRATSWRQAHAARQKRSGDSPPPGFE
jgi:hypothetical protein